MERQLDETKNYSLVSLYEDANLVDKNSGSKIFVGDFYGDPELGIISKQEDWCVIAGEGIVLCDIQDGYRLWAAFRDTRHDETKLFLSKEDSLEVQDLITKPHGIFVTTMKVSRSGIVEIQLDPMSTYTSRWSLNVKKKSLKKLLNTV